MMDRRCVLLSIVLCWVVGPGVARPQDRPRELAPGVLIEIPPDERPEETSSGPRPFVEIVRGLPDLEWTPKFSPESVTLLEKARSVTFRRTIWGLNFEFKPMRMIEADVPQPSGRMQRKLIWYMVYRVQNRGYALSPTPSGVTFDTTPVNYATRRFFPEFVLASHEFDKEYLDRVLPLAQEAIQRRENPGAKLHNSVEITRVPIPLSDDELQHYVWGVAMWEDVDPRVDFFSVYVRGLTNAFRFQDPDGAYQPGDPPGTGRRFQYKTLQLNFWRPGDALLEHEREMRFGVPVDSDPTVQQQILDRYGLERRLDYLWVYR